MQARQWIINAKDPSGDVPRFRKGNEQCRAMGARGTVMDMNVTRLLIADASRLAIKGKPSTFFALGFLN